MALSLAGMHLYQYLSASIQSGITYFPWRPFLGLTSCLPINQHLLPTTTQCFNESIQSRTAMHVQAQVRM